MPDDLVHASFQTEDFLDVWLGRQEYAVIVLKLPVNVSAANPSLMLPFSLIFLQERICVFASIGFVF